MSDRRIITLLTDFGQIDTYVGTMKGVILGVNRDARVVDLSHEVGPQDIIEGAYLLKTAYRYFPKGTIHLAVVDPGVGTPRRAIALSAGGWFFLGPDNGLFSYVLRDEELEQAVELTNPRYLRERAGDTFHGRDVFAPSAAHISTGLILDEFGPNAQNLVVLDSLEPHRRGSRLIGRVLHIDRFGNCITNIERFHAEGIESIRVRKVRLARISRTYSDVPEGRPIALFGSSGHLEIAVNGGSAASALGIGKGDEVQVVTRAAVG